MGEVGAGEDNERVLGRYVLAPFYFFIFIFLIIFFQYLTNLCRRQMRRTSVVTEAMYDGVEVGGGNELKPG